jgi:hypothetical protein
MIVKRAWQGSPILPACGLPMQVAAGMEDRLSRIEALLAERHVEQLADLHGSLKGAVMDTVNGRLEAFEREVQTRLLLATGSMHAPAGLAQEQQQQQQQGHGFRQHAADDGTALQLEERLQRFEDLLQQSIANLAEKAQLAGKDSSLDQDGITDLVDRQALSGHMCPKALCTFATYLT